MPQTVFQVFPWSNTSIIQDMQDWWSQIQSWPIWIGSQSRYHYCSVITLCRPSTFCKINSETDWGCLYFRTECASKVFADFIDVVFSSGGYKNISIWLSGSLLLALKWKCLETCKMHTILSKRSFYFPQNLNFSSITHGCHYVNDIDDNISGVAIKFADDMKPVSIVNTDHKKSQDDISLFGSWSDRWLMPFNIPKCEKE
jgi:hypothetical protein